MKLILSSNTRISQQIYDNKTNILIITFKKKIFFRINQAIAELKKYMKISNDHEKKLPESVETSCSTNT